MSTLIDSIRGEYLRYKRLAEGAIAQVRDDELMNAGDESNSIAVICQHLSGNLRSRFTDFLTTDGEKPWRDREAEFDRRAISRATLLEEWESGWSALLTSLDSITDADLRRTVTIRQQPLLVHEALHRSLAHTAYHVGQIVYLAKTARGPAWTSLSIPRGQSDTYNKNPTRER